MIKANSSLGKRQDELVSILENEEDFASSKTILEEELEKRGAKCIFTPKFHPELNPAECSYRWDIICSTSGAVVDFRGATSISDVVF